MRVDFGEWCIRSFVAADADAIVRYANNRRISINLRDRFPCPYTRADAEAFLAAAWAQQPESDFAIASRHEVIGGIGFHRQADVYRLSAEIGYWLGEPFWGRGIATQAVRALADWVFATTPLVRLYAHVFEWNPASARVLEKAGFTLEGRMRRSVIKDGRIIDQLTYALVRE
jgi:[ribosomal protein S5]-alanine N-acetyltransferase